MKTKMILLTAAFGLTSAFAFGQTITGLFTPVTENFSSYQGTEVTLPSGVSTFGSGFPNYGGFYDRDDSYSNSNLAYALRDNSSSSEIAFGMKRPASTAVASLNWQLTNDTGGDITSFTITWDAWQLSEAGRATELTLFNYNAGSGFTSDGLTSSTFTASTAPSDANLSAISVSPQSATINLTSALEDGNSITLGWRWLQGAGGGGNAHVGLTDISVTAIPEPSSIIMMALAGLAAFGILRNRKK